MKIDGKTINLFLATPQKDCQAVLIYGADSGRVRELVQKITATILGADVSDSFAKIELSEAEILADPARLADELSAISMMASKRVIIIRDAGNKLTKIIDDSKSCFNKDTYLILSSDELDSKSTIKAFFEKTANCAAVACYKDEVANIQSIIRTKFTEAGVKCDSDVVVYLASQLGNDRFVTYQELDKIILFVGDDKILKLSDAMLLINSNQDTKLDDLVNAVADKNLPALEKNLSQHITEGTQPILYLRSLQRYFSRLYDIRAKMASGQNADMAVSSLRPPVFWSQKPHLIRHANSWNIDAIVSAINLLLSAELACKTSDIPPISASSRKLFQITRLK